MLGTEIVGLQDPQKKRSLPLQLRNAAQVLVYLHQAKINDSGWLSYMKLMGKCAQNRLISVSSFFGIIWWPLRMMCQCSGSYDKLNCIETSAVLEISLSL